MLNKARIYERYLSSCATAGIADGRPDFSLRRAYLQKLIRDHFPGDRTAHILDLGCGHGALLHFCREAGYSALEGVDVSPEQVCVARDMGLDNVKQGDLFEHLRGVSNEAIDVVVAFDVVEHFPRGEVMNFCQEIERVLKPGGKLILHTPNGESPFFGAILYGDFTHEVAFTRLSMVQLGKITGFSRISSYEDPPIPHGAISLLRWTLWKFMRLAFHFVTAVETGDASRRAILSRNFLTVMIK
jgi:SAM-dependent methyltransferase